MLITDDSSKHIPASSILCPAYIKEKGGWLEETVSLIGLDATPAGPPYTSWVLKRKTQHNFQPQFMQTEWLERVFQESSLDQISNRINHSDLFWPPGTCNINKTQGIEDFEIMRFFFKSHAIKHLFDHMIVYGNKL